MVASFVWGAFIGVLLWFVLFFLNYGLIRDVVSDGDGGPLAVLQRLLPGESDRDRVVFPVLLLSLGAIGARRAWGRGDQQQPPRPVPRTEDPERARSFDRVVAEPLFLDLEGLDPEP